MTSPLSEANIESSKAKLTGYNSSISASYVKFLETGGARIVPIDYRLKKAKLYRLLSELNGVYIAGTTEEVVENE